MKGMATWLKVLLIISALCVIGVIGMCAVGFYFFQEMTSPTKISAIANKFMTIDSPLPAGNAYIAGADFMVPFVVINNNQSKTVYTFFETPASKSSTDVTAEQTIDAIAQGKEAPNVPGGTAGTTAPKKLKVASRDTLVVGGLKMPYVIGSSERPGVKSNNVQDIFFGSVKTPSNKMIFVMGQQTDPSADTRTSITIDNVKQLTAAIKGWK
jgi:hypothetical protein